MDERLLELALERDEIANLDAAERRLALRALVVEKADARDLPGMVAHLADEIDGFGRLSDVMRDQHVTDVLINGPSAVWIERAGRMERTSIRFGDERDLRSFIERLLASVGARADASHPIADARLRDGSRIHVVLPPLAPQGPLVSIRRFTRAACSMSDLVGGGMLTDEESAFLCRCVQEKITIAISGGTGTGKTTLLNALLAHVGPEERVVVVEETPELRPACHHVVSLVARQPNVEGKGAVELNALVRAALRMRPDRIVVGEVRGPEALTALSAMSTGHEGSLVTIHARSADDALQRMVSLALQASSGASEASLATQVQRAFGVVVHLRRDHARRCVSAIKTVE